MDRFVSGARFGCDFGGFQAIGETIAFCSRNDAGLYNCFAGRAKQNEMFHIVPADQHKPAFGVDCRDLDNAQPALSGGARYAARAVTPQNPGKAADQTDDDHERQHKTSDINQVHNA